MKKFTPIFVLCFILFPFFISCTQQKEIQGNYEIVKETIAISDYNEILLDLSAEVIYEQLSQEAPFLQVCVDKNIYPFLNISVQKNCLVITQDEDSLLKPSQLKIFTNSRNIKKIHMDQGGDLILQREVNARDMEIVVSGPGNVKADSLYCENLKVSLFGDGDLDIAGAATHANFKVNGSGDIKASNYLVQHLDCAINGSGDVEVYVHGSLKVSKNGSGSLIFKGKPVLVSTEKKGSGEIVPVVED